MWDDNTDDLYKNNNKLEVCKIFSKNILIIVYALHTEAYTSSVDVYVGAKKESRNDVLQ